jgi:hypothetical protein
MARSKYPPEVRFSIEGRESNPAQLGAGERLFGSLSARARASLTGARVAANESSEHSDEHGRRGRRQPPALPDPLHLLTGGSQTPAGDGSGD